MLRVTADGLPARAALAKRPALPAVITGTVTAWPAWRAWTWQYLQRALAGVDLYCGDDEQGDEVLASIDEVIIGQGSDAYIFDDMFHITVPELLPAFRAPAACSEHDLLAVLPDIEQAAQQDCTSRPPWRWLLIGGAGTGSALHVDPLGTCAWNACIRGIKLWILAPPGAQLPALGEQTSAGAWWSSLAVQSSHTACHQTSRGIANTVQACIARSGQSHRAPLPGLPALDAVPHAGLQERACLVNAWHASQGGTRALACRVPGMTRAGGPLLALLQVPGQIVAIPAGWQHAVLNVTRSVAVTQNYLQPSHAAEALRQLQREAPADAAALRAAWHQAGLRFHRGCFEDG